MHLSDRGIWLRLRRPVAISVTVLLALVAPTWLWFVRGRQLPVNVTLSANRYTARAGTTVSLKARIWPTPQGVEMAWQGPGVQGKGDRAQWRVPQQLGVHTAKLTVRRSGAVASDAVSIRVTASEAARCDIHRPPAQSFPPRDTPACPPPGKQSPKISLQGENCWGANLVARIHAPVGQSSWIWWTDTPTQSRKGPLANFRLPAEPPSGAAHAARKRREITALVFDPDRQCHLVAKRSVAIGACRAGPAAQGFFSDFRWELIGPSSFRFVAKPPRGIAVKEVYYLWLFGDGHRRRTLSPVVVHRFAKAEAQYVVSLETVGGKRRALAVKAISDRSAHLTAASGASTIPFESPRKGD